MNVKMSS